MRRTPVPGAPRRRLGAIRAICLFCTIVLVTPTLVLAQQARPSRVAIDTAAAIDHSVDGSGNHTTGIMVDAIVSVGLGRGFEVVAWPIAQRVANTGSESADIWIATLRYERAGPDRCQDRRGAPWISGRTREPHRTPPPPQSHHLTARVIVLSVASGRTPRSAWKPSGGHLSIRRAGHGIRRAMGRSSGGDRYVSPSTARHLRRSEAASIYQCRRRWRRHAVHRFPHRCFGDPRRLDGRWREPHQHGWERCHRVHSRIRTLVCTYEARG